MRSLIAFNLPSDLLLLAPSPQRHYAGLFKSRETTTSTFDGVVSSQGSGGFQKGGPTGWDMATSGFAEIGDRTHLLFTGTENVTGLTAIKKWTPVRTWRYENRGGSCRLGRACEEPG